MTLFAALFLGGTTEIAGLGGITSELLAELPQRYGGRRQFKRVILAPDWDRKALATRYTHAP